MTPSNWTEAANSALEQALNDALWCLPDVVGAVRVDRAKLVNVKSQALATLNTAVKTHVIDSEVHYGCGKNDEEVVVGSDPSGICCECYPHESCTMRPVVERLRAEQRKIVDGTPKKGEKTDGTH